MTHDSPDKTVRLSKTIRLDRETWDAINAFRFDRRIKSEMEAFREIIALGLKLADAQAKKGNKAA